MIKHNCAYVCYVHIKVCPKEECMSSLEEASDVEYIRHAICERYKEKYGDVDIKFDKIEPLEEHNFRVRYTIMKGHDFITRYYGRASFKDAQLHLTTKAI
jgi:hypothetical protein